MAPRRCCNKSVASYYGVRHRDSGRYGAEITVDRERVWLGTLHTPELTTRVYDAATWRLGRQKRDLNFPKEQSRHEAEFLAP
jgi:hypothetical protein